MEVDQNALHQADLVYDPFDVGGSVPDSSYVGVAAGEQIICYLDNGSNARRNEGLTSAYAGPAVQLTYLSLAVLSLLSACWLTLW